MVLIFSTFNLNEENKIFISEIVSFFKKSRHETVFFSGQSFDGVYNFEYPWDINFSIRHNISPKSIEKAIRLIDYRKWLDRVNQAYDIKDEKSLQYTAGLVLEAIQTLKPNFVITVGTKSPHNGIPFDIAKKLNIPTLVIERGFFPNSYMIDAESVDTDNDIVQMSINDVINKLDKKDLYNIGKEALDNVNVSSNDRWKGRYGEIKQELPITDKVKLLYLGADMQNMGFFPEWHSDNSKVIRNFKNSINAANTVEELHLGTLVYKPHPTIKNWDFSKVSKNIAVFFGDFNDALNWADVIITDGSATSEMSSLLYKKPVVQLGTSYFTNKNICYEVHNREDLEIQLKAAIYKKEFDIKLENLNVYIGFLLENYLAFSKAEKKYLSIESRLNYLTKDIAANLQNKLIQKLRIKFFFSKMRGHTNTIKKNILKI
jgi:hypothetical protein